MLIAMFILYPILVKWFDLSTKVIFPLTALFLLGYLENTWGITDWDTWSGLCYTGILRAAGEIALGAAMFPAVKLLSEKGSRLFSRNGTLLLTIIKYGCYVMFLVLCYGFTDCTKYTLSALLVCALGVALSFSGVGYSIPDSRLTRYRGKISLPIFIFHGFLRLVCKDITGSHVATGPALLLAALSVVLSVGLMYVTDFVTPRIKRVCSRVLLQNGATPPDKFPTAHPFCHAKTLLRFTLAEEGFPVWMYVTARCRARQCGA